MKLGAKLFITSIVLIGVSVSVADLYLTRQTDAYVTATVRDDLAVRARVVAREASTQHFEPDDFGAWDALADVEGRTVGARVTLVRADGVVLGDSEVETSALPKVENHAARPEIAEALAGHTGSNERTSATIKERLLYVAVPVEPRSAIAVARVAKPLEAVETATAGVRRIVWTASGFALLLAAILSAVVARRMSRVVGDISSTARKMRQGDLERRTNVKGNDELAELGGALDSLAENLATTLGTLRTERDLLARILEGMREGVLVLDDEDRVAMMNPAFRDMLLLGSEARGRLFLEVARHAELQDVIELARKRGSATAEIDIEGIQPRRLLVHASSLEGEDANLLAVCVDVTDVRRLESLRRDFVANVSHELRTPVAAVRSATETLQGGALSDPKVAERFLDIIDRNAHRLQALIEDLLELSRLDAKKYDLHVERLDVEPAIQIVIASFKERAQRKNVRLEARIPKDVPALETDRRVLEQILGNLVDNAIKYCPAGSQVTIACRVLEDHLRVLVEDNGPGIEERHLPRLFERFYRVDAGRSREVGGTGLGLSIVKHLAEALGGEIGVDSKVGKGSTFWVDLPRRVSHHEEERVENLQ